MFPGNSRLSHASVCDDGSAIPNGCHACCHCLWMKTRLLYEIKVGSGMYEPSDHRPLFRLEPVVTNLFFYDLETERFNLGRVNFSEFNHKKSSFFKGVQTSSTAQAQLVPTDNWLSVGCHWSLV